MIRRITLDQPAWDLREILRYARVKDDDEAVCALIEECCKEAEPYLTYQVCYSVQEILRDGDEISFGSIRTASKTLRKALEGCEQVLLFAGTVGTPFDRLIQKYSRISPSRALILQSIGAERVEALCDAFQSLYEAEHHVHLLPRVSPGYGDMPLEMQRDVFMMLDCPRKIGVTLNESLLMSPPKSVTAFSGITDTCVIRSHEHCSSCGMTDCCYRNT